MEQNQELTFYYVENKCPSQNINGNLALYPISMSWAFGNLNAGWDIWIYLVSRRPQNSNVLHATPEQIIENVYRCSMEKFNQSFKECIKKKILKAAEEPDTYYFSELPSLTEEQYQMSKSILETQIENPAV